MLVESVNLAPFFLLICDGSTDYAVLEQETVYTCGKLTVMVRFLACKPMVRPNARPIATAIFEAVEMAGAKDWKQKLIVLRSDGAAVMQGRSRGVISYLKKEVGD